MHTQYVAIGIYDTMHFVYHVSLQKYTSMQYCHKDIYKICHYYFGIQTLDGCVTPELISVYVVELYYMKSVYILTFKFNHSRMHVL